MQRRAVGPAAWLIDDLDDPAAWAASVRELRLDGVIEVVPAERTVLVVCDRSEAQVLGERLDEVRVVGRDRTSTTTVVIDVVYDGADLVSVSAATGLQVDEVIDRHSSGLYTVAFCGFSPGFAYMKGLDPALQVPRRDTPRTTVPAGSVAIAGDYTSVYPSASPGGWHLIGTTTMVTWDAAAPQPALLAPGTTVQFRDVERR